MSDLPTGWAEATLGEIGELDSAECHARRNGASDVPARGSSTGAARSAT